MHLTALSVALAIFLSCLVTTPATRAAADAAGAGGAAVASRAVDFTVDNVNGSLLPCEADGTRHVLHGRLVGPAALLDDAVVPEITVYVHDFATGDWFWRFPDRRHNFARQMARAGQVSLVFDRLGYDDQDAVDGNATCLGAQADMVHQVVQQLRSGEYDSRSAHPRAGKVVLAGHSVGGAIAELEAASFGDVDGLALMSWSDSGPSARAVQEADVQTQTCMGGGDPRVDRPGYAYYGQSRRDFRELLFRSAAPAVQREAAHLRNPDPCGDALTLAPLVTENNESTRSIGVPVLLLFGADDVLNRPEGIQLQQQAYQPGTEVTTHVLAGTGSALPLEESAPKTRRIVAAWLCSHFGC